LTVQLSDDRSYMREAIALAARVPRRTWPNPPVGAIVVRDDGAIVGRGRHCGPGTPHAEVVALNEAGGHARGATLYCTLEPCNHQGRTPPCAPRVAGSGIRRLVVGVRDANPAVAGGGLEVARAAGVDISLGVCGDEALELIWPFVVTRAFERPFVVLKTATSMDGHFAPPRDPGVTGPVYLTSANARRDVHCMRRWADLVLVGARTILADRPTLDARLVDASDPCPASDPMPGYVDTDLSINASWPGRRHLVFGGRDSAPAERLRAVTELGGTVVSCEERDGRVLPTSLLGQLEGVGVHAVLLEGGPTLAHAFLAAGLVDRWVSFVAPIVLGGGPTWPSGVAQSDGALVQAPASHATAFNRDSVNEAGVFNEAAFNLTRCERVGVDARLVFDRARFEVELRRLTMPAGA
jgi:diaminohydroxyphosphoribosylaminopyrimidine deaminase / 5-amino-6-(5-phosphoribosylamino)uracil reductase